VGTGVEMRSSQLIWPTAGIPTFYEWYCIKEKVPQRCVWYLRTTYSEAEQIL
jgi:hypothetical protein